MPFCLKYLHYERRLKKTSLLSPSNTPNLSHICSEVHFQSTLVLKEQEFEPDEPETVLAAFRLLDPEGKGYIEIEEMKRHL